MIFFSVAIPVPPKFATQTTGKEMLVDQISLNVPLWCTKISAANAGEWLLLQTRLLSKD